MNMIEVYIQQDRRIYIQGGYFQQDRKDIYPGRIIQQDRRIYIQGGYIQQDRKDIYPGEDNSTG